jgi:uncharacterized RDD family membrane protein YckC
MKTSSLLIRTPEGIIFSQLLGGPVTRFLAWLIDILCIGVLLNVLGTLLRVLDIVSLNISLAAITVGYFVINIGYGIFCEWAWRGQTIGKKLLGLRVVDAEGMRMQFNQIVTRNLLRFVDMLPAFYLVGGAACWFSRRCQRLGDVAANTIVIRTAAVTEPNLDRLAPGKFNSLRHYPHLAARLRQRVSPYEAATALHALLRRDQFEPAARVELFQELAAHFRLKVAFPAEATDSIPDEQYIHNVVDVIYRV